MKTFHLTIKRHVEPNPLPPSAYPPGVWELVNLEELGAAVGETFAHTGSFSNLPPPYGSHGQGNGIWLGKPEIKFQFSIRDNALLDIWAIGGGDIYPDNDHPHDPWNTYDRIPWPFITISSRQAQYPRQLLHVLEFSDDGQHLIGKPGRVARVEGIPHLPDYSAYSPEKQPWLFHDVWTQAKDGGYDYSHSGLLFSMAIWDTWGGHPVFPGTYGPWIKVECLYRQLT